MKARLSHHDIYDAVLDDSLFETLPARMAQEIEAPSSVFFWLHPGDLQEVTAGTQPEAHSDYEDFMDRDPWMAVVSDDLIGAGAFRLTDFVSAEAFQKSEMYNDYVLKNRLDRFWCMGLVQATRDGMVATAFHKGKRAGDFSDEQLGFVNRHAADLGRLHAIRRELIRNDIHEIAAADRTLMNDLPVLELDHEGRLLRLNGMAEQLLLIHPFVQMRHSRHLSVSGPQARAYRQAVGVAVSAEVRHAGMVELPPVRANDGRLLPELRLNLLPRTDGGRRVLVIITTQDPVSLPNTLENPQEKIVLSAREREVLEGLIRGLRRDKLAHDLGLAIPTVDLHMANLRRKLGARTMPEAIATAFRMGVL
ncbi:LuxR C-terminal-related transcriptional regulator [Pseudooceanicola sp. HF7]|uniref:helix-turn-helix transcriptional regulator n=1 Tax=Pseudooceanicola sp. HF7 TaxID=2721560 RepID=UPI0014322E3A|nr:LuxR C-terminal-related transcriptional regulator [Pseudooceanicola sp. HF7]NIZ07937.1 hypothetical protein [Pseudooceanicola sp. HF7]